MHQDTSHTHPPLPLLPLQDFSPLHLPLPQLPVARSLESECRGGEEGSRGSKPGGDSAVAAAAAAVMMMTAAVAATAITMAHHYQPSVIGPGQAAYGLRLS